MTKTILIVDQDVSFSNAVQDALNSKGLEIVSATDGESGLMAFTIEQPVIAIIETNLPDGSGLYLAQQIRETEGGEIPIILVSDAATSEDQSDQLMETSITALVTKPLDIPAFAQAIKLVTEGDDRKIYQMSSIDLKEASIPPSAPPSQERSILEAGQRLGVANFESSATETPIPVVFAHILRERLTGILECSRDRVRKAVYFTDGTPIYARSNSINELLGNILLKLGKITQSQLGENIKCMKETKRRQGELFVEMGVLDEKQLRAALRAQVRIKVYNLFGWTRGTYVFHKKTEFPEDVTSVNLSPSRILFQGISQRFGIELLRPLLAPFLDRYPLCTHEAHSFLESARLADEEWDFVDSINGSSPLKTVLENSPLGEERAAQTILTLALSDTLTFETERAPGEAPTETSDPDVIEQMSAILSAPPVETENGPSPHTNSPEKGVSDLEKPDTKTAKATSTPTLDTKAIHAEADRLKNLNHFEVLGLSKDASESTVKEAYRDLAKIYHPDHFVNMDSASARKADEIFARINEAYGVLSNAKDRHAYEEEGIHGNSNDASAEANAILTAEDQFQEGERYLNAGNLRDALKAFGQARSLYPEEGEYQSYYGWVLWKINTPGDKQKAREGEKILRDSVNLVEKNAPVHYFLGYIARVQGNIEEAKTYFKKALQIHPDHIEAQRELMLLDRRNKKKSGGLFNRFKK